MSDKTKENELQTSGRRKVIKKIGVAVGALVAYHVLPTNWTKPIIEQVFLPAHAATSGEITINPDPAPPNPDPAPPKALSCGDPLFPVPITINVPGVTVSQNPWLGTSDLMITDTTGTTRGLYPPWNFCDGRTGTSYFELRANETRLFAFAFQHADISSFEIS